MDVRVSALPTIHGEKLVLRLLPTQADLPTLRQLGMTADQEQAITTVMVRPQGFLLVTGPTGAGKSNTLYSALTAAVAQDRNAITLEDPVEMQLDGVTQVQINDQIDLTFSAALRSALRQDPDVMMVGEIRYVKTGQMAVRASLTGHLVLSTMHTLDAPASVRRLLEMGIPNYLIASSLTLVVAQRLVRIPCTSCMVPTPPDPDTVRRLGLTPAQSAKLVWGPGCKACDNTGYRGRTGVFEVLRVTAPVRRAILENADADRIATVARDSGWEPLLNRAVTLATEQRTTAAEILRAVLVDTD